MKTHPAIMFYPLSVHLLVHGDAASPVFDLGMLNLLLFVGMSLVFVALAVHRSRGAVLKMLPSGLRAALNATLSAYFADSRAMATCFVLSLVAGIMGDRIFPDSQSHHAQRSQPTRV